jgi:putative ABC transport system permease protein
MINFLIFRLAFWELRGRLQGMGIFVLCVALGVMAVVSVGSMSDSFFQTLSRDGKVLLGGDASLQKRGGPFGEDVRPWLEGEGVEVSSMLAMRSMMVKEDRSIQQLVVLHLVDDMYPLYGDVELEEGEWEDVFSEGEGGLDGIAVARELALKWDIEKGDKLWFGRKLFEVRGIVVSEPDRNLRFGFFGPRVTMMTGSLEGTGLVEVGSLVRYCYRLRLGAGANLEDFSRRLSEKFPNPDWDLRTSENVDPNVENSVELVTEFMTLVALTIMLIGGVGIGNAGRAFLGGRLSLIAILKCLGATRREVFWVCFLLLLWMSFLGSVLGSVLGVLLPYVVLPILGGLLPIEVSPMISWSSVILGWGLGFLVMLIFVWISLSLATKEHVGRLFRQNDGLVVWKSWLEADLYAKLGTFFSFCGLTLVVVWGLDHRDLMLSFLVGVVIVYLLFYVLGRCLMGFLRKIPRLKDFFMNLALSSLYRPGNMTVAVLMSLGIGLTVLVSIAMVQGSVLQTVRDLEGSDVPSFFLVDVQEGQRERLESLLDVGGIADDKRREALFSPILRARIVSMGGVDVEDIEVPPDYNWVLEGDRALTWDDTPDLRDDNRLLKGEWWDEGYEGELLVSFDHGAAEAFGLGLGDSLGVRVLGRVFEAKIANLRGVRWESLSMNFLMVFPESSFRGAPFGYLSSVYLPEGELTLFEKRVVEEMPNVTPLRLDGFVEQFRRIFEGIALGVLVMGWFAILTGVVVLGGVMLANHEARVGQAIIYKVVGMTRKEFVRQTLWEFGLVGFVGSLGSMVMGSVSSYLVVTFVMNLDWRWSPEVALYTSLCGLGVTLCIGIVHMWYVQGRSVGLLLRNE